MAGKTIDSLRIDTSGQFGWQQNTVGSSTAPQSIPTNQTTQLHYRMNNVGSGAPLYVGDETIGDTLLFKLKTIQTGDGISITTDNETITISASVAATGVSTFHQLLDTPNSYSGRAGRYVAVKSDESGLEFVQPPNRRFTELTDVPGTYSGNNNRYVRVNTAGTGLEFVNLPAFSSVSHFIQLADVPNNYSGNANTMVTVNSSATGLEFRPIPMEGVEYFRDLLDGPGTMNTHNGKFITVNSSGTALEYTNKPQYGFLELTDTPNGYSTFANYFVKVNSSGTGLVFEPSSLPVINFNQLADVPNNYSSHASKIVRVKSDESGLEFYTLPALGSTTFAGLTDTPASYNLHAGKTIRVKNDESGLEFFMLPTIPTRLTDFVDFPGSYTASKYLRVNTTGTGVEQVDLPNFSYVRSFIELNDVPNNYTGNSSKYLRVNTTGTALEFGDLPPLVTTFIGLTDTPLNYNSSSNKYLRVNPVGNAIEFVDLPTIPTTFTALVDTPSSLVANKWLQVNSDGTALVFVDPPTATSTFAGLTDTPANYTGAGGRYVAVKNDESGLEYVNTPTTTLQRYTFRVNFNSSGVVDSVSNLPLSWTYSITPTGSSGMLVTINHNVNNSPLIVTADGWDSTNSRYRRILGYSSTTFSILYDPTNNNTFTFGGSNFTAGATGASNGGYALVTVVF
jgi:hypothetical protein